MAFPFWEGSGPVAYDPMRRGRATAGGNGIDSWESSPNFPRTSDGFVANIPSADYLKTGYDPNFASGQGWTMLVFSSGTPAAVGNGAVIGAIADLGGAAGNDPLLWIIVGSNGFVYRARDSSDGDTGNTNAGDISGDQLWSVALVREPDGTIRAYIDGREVSTSSGITGAMDFTGFDFWLGGENRRGALQQSSKVTLRAVYGWDRALRAGELLELERDPYQFFRPVDGPEIWGEAAPGVPVGTASEVDAAQAVTPSKAVEIGTATQRDLAEPIVAGKAVEIGTATEADTAQAISPVRTVAVGTASEGSVAQTITPSKSAQISTATEADVAQPVTPSKAVDVGIATEQNVAQPITTAGAVDVGTASEVDAAQSIAPALVVDVGTATETDVAQSITAAKVTDVGTASEQNVAQPISTAGGIEVGTAAERDTAQAVTPSKAAAVGTAAETDVAQTITPARAFDVGTAIEQSNAQALAILRTITVGVATERDLALPITTPAGAVPEFPAPTRAVVTTASRRRRAKVTTASRRRRAEVT